MTIITLNEDEFDYLLGSMRPTHRFVNEKLVEKGYENMEILDIHDKPIIRFVRS